MQKTVIFGATILLTIFFAIAFLSSQNDSVIFDETAHIGAGYSYLTERDMRLNPEHPPLIKDLAAFPLVFMNLRFPTNTDAWQREVNGQWNQGGGFLFEFGNNPDRIMKAARVPIMLLAVLVGIVLFRWVRGLYGNRVALLTLFFYTFSPTVIAHSRFVTTDIAATFGFLIGIASFIRFLAKPSSKRLAIAGLAFGVAQTLKFSLFLLIPIDTILFFFWLLAKEKPRKVFSMLWKTACVFAIGAVVIWFVFLWHVWDYPQERQLADAQTLIGGFKPHQFVDLDLWLIGHGVTRPLGQYLLGVMMVTQRTAGGNSAYFWGEVSSGGWAAYFPTLYFFKEPLAFHILSVLALVLALIRTIRAKEKTLAAIRGWIQDNFALFASIFFIAFYWASSVVNPLNIGIRHVLPTFPFIYLLVSRELVLWTSGFQKSKTIENIFDVFRFLYKSLIEPLPKFFVIALLLSWIVASVLISFPYYLSYYNELVGGVANGYKIATDSNYDWGQDLKRLRDFAKDHPDEKIYLHYFGGSTRDNGAQKYWLGEQFVPWYSSFGPPPSGSIFAISVNELMGLWATPVKGFPPPETKDSYPWLRTLKPFGRAGTSIFLYRIP